MDQRFRDGAWMRDVLTDLLAYATEASLDETAAALSRALEIHAIEHGLAAGPDFGAGINR